MLSKKDIVSRLGAALAAAVVAAPAVAGSGPVDSVSFEFGDGKRVQLVRLAVQSQWDSQWFKTDGKHLAAYLDTSIAKWRGTRYRNTVGARQDITTVGFTPIFRYQADDRQGWYAEGGIGVNYLSDLYDNDDNRLSTHFQFGDHIGAGYVMGQWDMGVKIQHYSNGGYKKPNSGVNFIVLKAAYAF